ncbi:MAG: hypothetical protein AABW51_03095 [Nanoarchaeota archaeon]
MELSDRLESGFSHLMVGIPLYLISSVAKHFSSNDYHKYIQGASKGLIRAGIGVIRDNREIIKQGKMAMNLADSNYPEIAQRYK